MNVTSVFGRNISAFNNGKRYIINQGGTSSSKTYSILQLLILIALKKDNLLISIVSESLPHLKRGAMRDFQNILLSMNLYNESMHNKSNNEFIIGNSKIEFFSADASSKLRGARRDILYINEANNIDKNSFDELSIRTKQSTFIDYNPVSEFWVHNHLLNNTSIDIEFIKSTFRDNEFLDVNIVKDIERRKESDYEWYKVYGLGEIGNLEGVIFNNYNIVKELPDTPKRILGCDFGFTNDATAIVDIRYSDGEIYIDELLYQTDLTNNMIAKFITSDADLKSVTMICDSAEPKSIAELQMFGVRCLPADKGADSIRNGIDLMKQYKINITERSTNLIKEIRNYRWKTDRAGKSLNVPIDIWNHCIDASRYGCTFLLGSQTKFIKPRIHY
jgi:phage terminase large subunit